MRSPLVYPLMAGLPALAAIAALAAVRWRAQHGPRVLLELRPMDGAQSNPEAWARFFDNLYVIVPPAWKRWLVGVPALAFELVGEAGRVRARCEVPADREILVSTLIRSASPGIGVSQVVEPVRLAAPAARTGLRLWDAPLFPLGWQRPDGLRWVIDALARGPQNIVQIVVCPEVRWQGRALRHLDELDGINPDASLPARVLSGLVGIVFDLIWSGDARVPAMPPPSHRHPVPPSDKALRPGYRATIRLRAAGSTKKEARARAHALVASFRSFDGPRNGLRSGPIWVWFRRWFDRALLARNESARNSVLVPEELAALFHLPIASADMEAAPVRVPPPAVFRRAA